MMLTKKWFGLSWGARVPTDESTRRGSMAPEQFMVEYWKLYESYMQRKEHLIEASVLAYSGLCLALLTRSTGAWRDHGPGLLGFGLAAGVLVGRFSWKQFLMWRSGARACTAAQSLAAEWLVAEHVPQEALALRPIPALDDVPGPAALASKLPREKESERFVARNLWRVIAVYRSPFAFAVYGLILLWWLALAVRAYWAGPPEWWGLPGLWTDVLRFVRRASG
jgi:hypothetical protein